MNMIYYTLCFKTYALSKSFESYDFCIENTLIIQKNVKAIGVKRWRRLMYMFEVFFLL